MPGVARSGRPGWVKGAWIDDASTYGFGIDFVSVGFPFFSVSDAGNMK